MFRHPVRMLAVILILGWLGLGLIGKARHPISGVRAQEATARGNIRTLLIALEMFYADCGRLPRKGESLASLVHDPGIPGWNGPYILALKPDPWGHYFSYEVKSAHEIIVFSVGPDGTSGTRDDIRTSKIIP